MTAERRREVEKFILQKLEEIRFECEDALDDTEIINMTVSKRWSMLFALDHNKEDYVLDNHWKWNID